MLRSVNRWLEVNRWAGDAVIATGLLLIALLADGPTQNPRALLMSVLLILPLYARRSRPRSVLVIVTLLCLLQLAVLDEPVFGDIAAPLVVHAVTAQVQDRRWGVGALITGLVGAALGAWQWQSRLVYGTEQFLLLAGAGVASVIAAYLLGARQRDQRERVQEQLTALQERNRLLAVERDQRTEMTAAAERARIARELHDIVAHSLSVIVVQADGGAAAITAAPDTAAELAPRVLNTIAGTSREALTEMRRIVAVLRSGTADRGADPDYAPAPGATELPALIAQVTSVGVPVTFETRGVTTTLPPTTELTVYRVVQESLTNVIKHAGPAANAAVTLAYLTGEVQVSVVDDGRGDASSGGDPGHGLVGMRERVLLQGGALRAGPRTGGGFAVQATLPLAVPARIRAQQ
jgi:signal transduction histidine kinase